MTYEWEFNEPSNKVDLERICVEINNVPAIFALSYLENLRKEAPIVYGRLERWAKENNRMRWYTWKRN